MPVRIVVARGSGRDKGDRHLALSQPEWPTRTSTSCRNDVGVAGCRLAGWLWLRAQAQAGWTFATASGMGVSSMYLADARSSRGDVSIEASSARRDRQS